MDDKAIQTHPGPTFYLGHPLSSTVRTWVPLKGQADSLSLFLMGWFDSFWTCMLEVHSCSQQTLAEHLLRARLHAETENIALSGNKRIYF